MIQLKATCLRCGGTGYCGGTEYIPLDTSASEFLPPLLCPDCEGEGILIFDDEKWDLILEEVFPQRISCQKYGEKEITMLNDEKWDIELKRIGKPHPAYRIHRCFM